MASLASARRGSWIQITAASCPAMTQIEVGVLASGRASNLSCSPAGMVQPSSSKTKWALPMQDLFAVYHAGDAVGHDVLHLRVVLLVGQAPALGLLHHGGGHGVGIVLLQTRRQT